MNEQAKLALKRTPHRGNDGQGTCAAVFERADKAFDDGNAPRLADRALAMADAATLAPGLESYIQSTFHMELSSLFDQQT
jgi:hypothetical protein